MKILGLRASRVKEWIRVLRIERQKVSYWGLIVHGLKIVTNKNPDSKQDNRLKYRTCLGCPIFDRETKACRNIHPITGEELGCGCYMPYKISSSNWCWLQERGFNE